MTRAKNGWTLVYDDKDGKITSGDYIVDTFELDQSGNPISITSLKESPGMTERISKQKRKKEYEALIAKNPSEFVLADYQRCEQLKKEGV